MPSYQFVAIDKTGRTVRGIEAARFPQEMTERLRERELTVLDLREHRNTLGKLLAALGFGKRLPLYPTMVMIRQLATMIKAGIPLGKILDNLTHQGLDNRVDKAVLQIRKEVRTGFSLTQAFENQAGKFPALTTPLIKAGEMSGNLEEMLERLAVYMEKDLALRRAWTQASVYPFMVFFACCVLTIGMVSYVFPTFIDLFKGLDITLPVFTRALITITETVRNPIVFMPALSGATLGGFLLWRYFQTPVGRRQWDWVRLELPYLGDLARKIALSRVARTLGTLLASGVPTLMALKISGAASSNSIIRDAIERVSAEMKRGTRLSEALDGSPVFPRVFVQMTDAGEQAGDLSVMLLRLGDFFEEEVQLALAAFTALIEPVMIAFMGALVMFVLVAVFQPIYQLMAMF